MNEIVIADKTIRVSDGLYCLNDLHRASGGLQKHRPSEWLRLAATLEIINELENEAAKAGNPALNKNQQVIKTNRGGNHPGTYACRELVYSYAMWISPKFHLQVVRTFDALAYAAQRPRLPAVLPFDLPVPKTIEEARYLAASLACERRTLDCKIARARPWLRYWQDLSEECGEAARLPEL